MMKRVICFGEALIDLLSDQVEGTGGERASGVQVQDALPVERFTKYAGGAPANVSVAAAKQGANAHFCGMLGDDMFGHFLLDALQAEGVNTDYVQFTQAANTALAFVSLDANGERRFVFYRPPAADLCFTAADFKPEWFKDDGLLHICSNSLTDTGINVATQRGVELALAQGWDISFDVNLRTNLWPDIAQARPRIQHLLEQAHVIKMAQEELAFMCQDRDRDAYIAHLLHANAYLVAITDGGNALQWYTRDGSGVVTPPKVQMVDATAAGDAFVGGLLAQLTMQSKYGDLTRCSQADWEHVLDYAAHCGAFAAAHPGAFPSLPDPITLARFFGADC